MEKKYCQSCGMPMDELSIMGTKDNLQWLWETYGEQNLVSAVLHIDEKTPHIHATIIPIVTGKRRKARQEEQDGKKKYRKKNPQEKGKFRLYIDGIPILEWFRMKFQEPKRNWV